MKTIDQYEIGQKFEFKYSDFSPTLDCDIPCELTNVVNGSKNIYEIEFKEAGCRIIPEGIANQWLKDGTLKAI